jgi:acyl-CoA thioesterase
MSETCIDPDQLAQAVSQVMYANDDASRLLGIKIIESRQGYARLSMIVKKEMTNGLDICHGGLIFTLADSAFAYACNSANKATVAAGCNIDFMAPGAIGDELIAVARERSRAGRTGIYDVEINNQNGDLIALFRGKSYQIKGQVIPQSGEQQ